MYMSGAAASLAQATESHYKSRAVTGAFLPGLLKATCGPFVAAPDVYGAVNNSPEPVTVPSRPVRGQAVATTRLVSGGVGDSGREMVSRNMSRKRKK